MNHLETARKLMYANWSPDGPLTERCILQFAEALRREIKELRYVLADVRRVVAENRPQPHSLLRASLADFDEWEASKLASDVSQLNLNTSEKKNE